MEGPAPSAGRVVRKVWSRVLPRVDEQDLEVLRVFCDNGGGPVTPYRVYRSLGLNPSTAYRRVRRLSDHRLVRESRDGKGYTITALGCILLYVRGLLGSEGLADCIGKCWNVSLEPGEVLAFLAVLGYKSLEKRLSPCEATAGGISSAAVHVIEVLEDAIEEQFRRGVRIGEALEERAREVGLSRGDLVLAVRVALRGLASSLPITLTTPRHKIVLLSHGRVLTPVAYECAEDCGAFRESLGIECPLLWDEVRGVLSTLLGAYGEGLREDQ